MIEDKSKEWKVLNIEEKIRYAHVLAKSLADQLDIKEFMADASRYALSLEGLSNEVLKEPEISRGLVQQREEQCKKEDRRTIELLVKEKEKILERLQRVNVKERKEEELLEQFKREKIEREKEEEKQRELEHEKQELEERKRREEVKLSRKKKKEKAIRKYRQIKDNIKFCKKSKKRIIKSIEDLNLDYERGVIDRKEYLLSINRKINGKTRLEWIDFCDTYINEKEEKVNNYRNEVRERIYSNIKPFLPISSLLTVLVIFTLLLFKLTTIGLGPALPPELLTIKESYNHTDKINLTLTESSEYIWSMVNYGNLKSIRLDGSISKEGSAKVYLEYNGRSYLIFDSSRLGEEGIKVSGLVVGDLVNNDSLDNKSEENMDVGEEGEPIKNNSLDNNSINKKIIKITIQGGGRKDIEDMFEFNISSEFNWDVNYSKLCTKWDVNDVSLCYGSSDCCVLINLESLGGWNNSFYLSYGRYGAGFNNIIRAQVIYANYSLDIEHPYADIVYSDSVEITAEFYKAAIRFTDVCIETCLLPGFTESSYKLVFVIENATLQINNIKYSIEKELNISRNAPKLIKEIENITIYKNEFKEIDLSEYFYDEDNDKLTYTVYEVDNITLIVKDSTVRIIPEHNFTGKRYMYFTASDGYYKVSSNIFSINVIKKPLSVEEVNVSEQLIKPTIVINQPVKWVKIVNISASVINLSVNISSDALNVTVRDVKENRIISEDKIKINDNSVIKNYSVYRAEKRISQIEKIEDELTRKKEKIIDENPTDKQSISLINKELLELENERNKLTGYAVAAEGEGIITRFFEWLFNVDITGYVVYEPIENKTLNVTSIIIEDVVKEVEIEYYTESPIAEEENISSGKRIVISSDVHYENILAYTKLPTEASVSSVHLYWLVNNSIVEVEFKAYDNNRNNLVDYIEWVVPYLSNQSYELEIIIINAENLDKKRNFVKNIYEEVREIDNITYTVAKKEYVRAYFQRNLTSKNFIDIFVRNTDAATIEVYENDSDIIVGKIENLTEGTHYILLNHTANQSIFDMKSIGRDVIYDYIHDAKPAPLNSVSVTAPTKNQQIGIFESFTMRCTVSIGAGSAISPTVYFRLDENNDDCNVSDALIPQIGTRGTIIYGDSTTQTTTRCSSCTPSVSTTIYGYEIGGPYTICCHANDRATNVVSPEMITVEVGAVDNIPPKIEIVYPFNNTNTSNNQIDVNYTVLDINLNSCWYSNDTYTTNTTLANCENITTVIWSEGQHNVTVWANDSFGNVNSSSVTFTIDTTPPYFVNITNISTYIYEGIAYDVNASDDGIGIDCFAVNNTINFKINCSGFLENATTLSIGEYWLNITVNDTLNNLNSIIIHVNVTQNQPPTIPTNIQCDGSKNCNILVNDSVILNASGSIDLDKDNITYFIEALFLNITTTDDKELGVIQKKAAGSRIENRVNIMFEDFESSGWQIITGEDPSTGCSRGYGNFNNCMDNRDYHFAKSSGGSAVSGMYIWVGDDWDNWASDAGIWYNFNPQTACNGNPCNEVIVSGYGAAGSLDTTNEYCRIWARNDTSTNYTDIWYCTDGYSCEFSNSENDIPTNPAHWTYFKTNFTSVGLNLVSSTNASVHIGGRIPDPHDQCFFEDINITGLYYTTGTSNEMNTSETLYEDVDGNYNLVTSITIKVEVDSYNPEASVQQGTNDPDLYLEIYNGSGWISIGRFNLDQTYTSNSLDTTNYNFSQTITEPSILAAWQNSSNQDIRIKGVYMDYYDSTVIDEINYTNVWITIEGKQWVEIGNHTNETTLKWNTTNEEQTCIDLRARAIDILGSNKYSDYFTKGCCLNISHGPPPAISISLSEKLSQGIIWNIVSLPVYDHPAEGNNGNGTTGYDVAISATGTTVDLYIKADGDLTTEGGDVIGLGNERFSYSSTNSSVPSTNMFALTTDYLNNKIGDDLPDGSYVYLKFFLNAPASQAAGTYSNQVSIISVPHGQSP